MLHALLCNCGFRATRGNTCTFGDQERDIVVMVHGDGFVSAAGIADLRWLQSMLKKKFEITTDVVAHQGQK